MARALNQKNDRAIPLSQNQQRRIRCLAAKGWSRADIAAGTGIPVEAVRAELRVDRNPPTLQEQAQQLIKDGADASVVLANFGDCSPCIDCRKWVNHWPFDTPLCEACEEKRAGCAA
jgi:hypothetical protein